MPDALHNELLREFGGKSKNDLNEILKMYNDDDPNDAIHHLGTSLYMYFDDLQTYLANHKNEFSVLSLNIPNIFSKFDVLFPIINQLHEENLDFGAICLQDISLIQFTNYKLIHQSKVCCGHGGLIMYLYSDFSYEIRDLFARSDIWEGLFIDITAGQITLGNICKPSKENNNNANIESFINEIAPILKMYYDLNLSVFAINGSYMCLYT